MTTTRRFQTLKDFAGLTMQRLLEYAAHLTGLTVLALGAALLVLVYELRERARTAGAVSPQDAVRLMKDLGVTYLRTGLSWADVFRPNGLEWFDRQMKALEPFRVTVTFCFTPEHAGLAPHHTSPPKSEKEFADFCAWMTKRYAC